MFLQLMVYHVVDWIRLKAVEYGLMDTITITSMCQLEIQDEVQF